ncbi:hypothetical protein EPUS_08155 [Endocarpon pusillum Z07020]|uniref:ADF-H domain-containing protein n=1 Tax=Endocarpon pusillum (strain Z07020 / HMAS-L-300199) TaxID=1263415 RepID=U1G1V6_ENDPU|nr:uncharacterized protein EPUS_08155 [Endocarpon pusillum Z07020]ERF71237.1 hypothetical protein EPUS_08155 [Endocarpon pusillum Z07020]
MIIDSEEQFFIKDALLSSNPSRSPLTSAIPSCSPESQARPLLNILTAATIKLKPYSPASTELHDAFTTFLRDGALFALPITITSESLTPLPALPFENDSFESSLPSLQPHVQPKTPKYIILRRSLEEGGAGDAGALTVVTYVPSDAPVRAKTLFASTRTTLIRELGRERFEGRNLFLTERREVLDPQEWKDRDRDEDAGGDEEGPYTKEEKELRGVRRAEDEERYGGTKGRDILGTSGGGGGGASGNGVKTLGFKAKMDDAAKQALAEMARAVQTEGGGGMLVQLSIDLATEILILSSSSTDVSPADLAPKIPADSPSYTFYHYPSSTSIIFIYCCPASPTIRERMLYASMRGSVVHVARDEGVEVSKRIEIGSPDEMGEERLREETAAAGSAAADDGGSVALKAGFARPRRPGKR